MPSSGYSTLAGWRPRRCAGRPAPSACRSSRSLPYHLARALVVPEPQEPGMAQLPLTGPFAEADLGDQLRPHPMHPRAGESPDRERRLVLLQRGQPPPEALEQLVVEAGPDLAGVDQLVAAVVAEQQSAEAVPGPLRVGVAADHQLLLVDALELQPVA